MIKLEITPNEASDILRLLNAERKTTSSLMYADELAILIRKIDAAYDKAFKYSL